MHPTINLPLIASLDLVQLSTVLNYSRLLSSRFQMQIQNQGKPKRFMTPEKKPIVCTVDWANILLKSIASFLFRTRFSYTQPTKSFDGARKGIFKNKCNKLELLHCLSTKLGVKK